MKQQYWGLVYSYLAYQNHLHRISFQFRSYKHNKNFRLPDILHQLPGCFYEVSFYYHYGYNIHESR